MPKVNLSGFGFNVSEDVTASTKTLDAGDNGVVQNVLATSTITLPATAVGATFIVRVGADKVTVAISPNSADNIVGNGRDTGVDNKDLLFTNQPAGSYVVLLGNGAGGYNVQRINGTATFES